MSPFPTGSAGAGLPPLRDVVAQHGLMARKSLGQHFLFDLNLTRRIARAAGDQREGTTIEVGPGPGGLTRALLEAGAGRVVVIERDPRFVPALEEIAAVHTGRLTIVLGDAMTVDVAALGPPPRRVVANLPYNVGTPLLLGWLAKPHDFASLTVMLQKEVVERIAAAPGDAAYGRLSVAAQWRWTARRVFDVPPSAFVPPPQVVSAVVSLVPREAPLAPADPGWLERVTAAAFGQRRKMLRGSLRSLGGDTAALLAKADIDPSKRAETLTIAQFCAIARAYAEALSGPRAAT